MATAGKGVSPVRANDFLQVFAAARSDEPVMIASGVSGAVWRHHHVPKRTLYNSGMSYTVPASFGLALARPDLRVLAVEGDGSYLMGLAHLATLGRYQPQNLVVVVYNNRTYMPTGTSGELSSAAAHGADLSAFATAAGIQQVHHTAEAEELSQLLSKALHSDDGPWIVVADVDKERASWDLKAPTRALDRVASAVEFQDNLRDTRPQSNDRTSSVKTKPVGDLAPEIVAGKPGWRNGGVLYEAIRRSGIDLVVYLPEGVLYPVQALAERDEQMESLCCSREDEGMAIAGGFALDDRVPSIVIEGTGVGMSGLVLASLIVRRRPLVIISSHSRVLGVRSPWNDQAAMVNEPVLDALGIPTYVLEDVERAELILRESVRSAKVLKKPVAVVVPPYCMDHPDDRETA